MRNNIRLILVAIAAFAATAHAQTPSAPAPAPFSHALGPLDGAHLTATVVEVRYAPGQASKPHSHPCDVIGYIIEGSYRMQVRGQPEVVYTAGQSFFEAANGVHAVSANASNDKPVRFLAYFICDRQQPLTVPVTDSTHR
jgi:quercetin dioxygenase-like cupin family protein